jgi:Leucine rich repeat
MDMKTPFFILSLLMAGTVSAQIEFKDCNPKEYSRIFSEAERLKDRGEYIEAKNRFEAASIYACNTNEKNKIDIALEALFNEINHLRETALAERERANAAKRQSDSLFLLADQERKRAEAALSKIYFYEDRYGLAYDKAIGRYGFIDKQTNIQIPFDFDEARSFDPQGLAQVAKALHSKNENGRDLTQYLLDTTGAKHPLELRKGRVGKETKAVDFSYSTLYWIPYKATQQGQLRVLRINHSRITKIPKRIRKLDRLQYVQLRHNRIKKIHENIGYLKSIQSFELNGNELQTLPKGIGGLYSLRVMNLSNNKIKKLPAEIGNLKNLQWLSLEQNKLDSIPPEIAKMENLKFLNLSHNHLEALPEELFTMKQLRFLDISNNALEAVEVRRVRKEMGEWCTIIHNLY